MQAIVKNTHPIDECVNKSEDAFTFWTAAEVAEIFFQGKIKYAKVLRMTRSGELPAIKRGKSYLYLRSALENWAEKTFAKPTWAQKQNVRKVRF
jgi:excisionase family DNA binding protein